MNKPRKRQRPKLATARSYYRLAGKASRAGNHGEWEHYWTIANRLVDQDRREQEAIARRKKSEEEWRKKVAAKKAAKEQGDAAQQA